MSIRNLGFTEDELAQARKLAERSWDSNSLQSSAQGFLTDPTLRVTKLHTHDCDPCLLRRSLRFLLSGLRKRFAYCCA